MAGWIVPPPKMPQKSSEDFAREREAKVRWLLSQSYLRSERIKQALLRVPRENFIPLMYKDYAYQEVPLPLPGERATLSCPHSYPLFYEPLGLDEGQKFLEVGLGSGYGAAVAWEIVGPNGLVVSMEIDPITYGYAGSNLQREGYHDVKVVLGDGGLGCPDMAPFDRICITAACRRIPPPLVDQLRIGGRLIGPVEEGGVQNLVLLEKLEDGLVRRIICEVLYVSLQGLFG